MTIKPVVLVTGANGQLGKELVSISQDKYQIIGLSRIDLDITDESACLEIITKHKPYAIIHCAAYTAVDKAESVKDEAFRVNETGTKNIAQIARKLNSKFVYVSTDYVFDGLSNEPYVEDDSVNPKTVYGASKLAGEKVVQQLAEKYFIVRTSWVFGKYGNNFVRTMLSLAMQNKPLKVVNDQIGCPTYTYDLAQLLLELIKSDKYGIYHASNSGICSWYEFASGIFEIAGLTVELSPCTTEDFPRPAPRPTYSVMSNEKLASNGFKPLRHWKEAVIDYLNDIKSSDN